MVGMAGCAVRECPASLVFISERLSTLLLTRRTAQRAVPTIHEIASNTPPLHRRSALEFSPNPVNMKEMTATATIAMIRREVGSDGICLLSFDRPESGANIFDAATMQDLAGQVEAIEKDSSLRGV